MKTIAMTGLFALVLVSGAMGQDVPMAPEPTKEHQWLAQFAGEWVTDSEIMMEPGKPAIKCKGTESARSIGGYWMVSESKCRFMDTPMNGIMTLGYDATKKKFIGTFVCSMCDHLWKYEGTLDESGKILTLEAEGPSRTTPGKFAKYRDVVEIKSKDHRVITSSMLTEDGKWVSFMTMNARRK